MDQPADKNQPIDPQENLKVILEIIGQQSAQEILDRCRLDPNFRFLCTNFQKQIWTALLQRDYSKWGLLDNPKEYYIRIAELNGIKLRDPSLISEIAGEHLIEEEDLNFPAQPKLMMQVGTLPPFRIARKLAQAYSNTLARLIETNDRNGITDANKWIFRIGDTELRTDVTQGEELIAKTQAIHDYFKTILSANVIPAINTIPIEFEFEIISITTFLECSSELCTILSLLVERRLTKLASEARIGNIQLEPVTLLYSEYNVAPGFVASYLRTISNILYLNDGFTQEIINYYVEVINLIPNIRAALMPHGYPFTKRENLDKLGKLAASLFMVSPLYDPVVSPDYFNAKVCAYLNTDDPNIQLPESDPDKVRVWLAGTPPPVINKVPTLEVITSRIEASLPGVVNLFNLASLEMRKAFPSGEAGFILAGGMLAIAMDDWLSSDKGFYRWKTDADLFVYGWTHDLRVRAFYILFDLVLKLYPEENGHLYKLWRSVVTVEKKIYLDKDFQAMLVTGELDENGYHKGRFQRRLGMQIINTNSKDAFEVIMNFDTSHIQIGLDCHRGLMATPFWQLYFPRRETLLVRYNIRSPRFVKLLYRGYTLKKIMPYSLILTPKGIGYSYVIRDDTLIELLPSPDNSYADDLEAMDQNVVRLGHVKVRDGSVKNIRSRPQESVYQVKIRSEKEEKMISTGNLGNLYGDTNVDYPTRKYGTLPPADVRNRVRFNGQFKNGFDAYVREKYLTYEIIANSNKAVDLEKEKPLDLENDNTSLSSTRYVIRDCKLLVDPVNVPVEYSTGTEKFNFSLRTLFLERKPAIIPYNPPEPVVYKSASKIRSLAQELSLKDNRGNHSITKILASPSAIDFPLEKDLGPDQYLNTSLTRHRYAIPMYVEGIVQIKANPDRANSGQQPGLYIYNVDNIDLHTRFYSDAEREAMPTYDFTEWQRIRLRDIKLPAEVDAVKIRVPVVITEALFLDEADWTMPISEVINNRANLMFNSMVYQDYAPDVYSGGTIMIFRSFKIFEP